MTKALKHVTTVLTVWEVLSSFMGLDTEMDAQSMGIVQEVVCPRKEDSPDHPDPTPRLAKKDMLRQAYYKYAREDGHHPESYRVFKTLYERHIEGKHVPFQRYDIPPKNEKRLKTIKSYFLILEPLYKIHADQNVFLYLTI